METTPIDHIDTNLYIGNVCAATDLETLKRHNITRVLNTCLRCPTRFPSSGAENIESMHLMLKDTPEEQLAPHMERALKFIGSLEVSQKLTEACFLLFKYGSSR